MDKKISQLTAATTPLAGTETLPIVQGGSTVKATVQDVLGYVVNDATNSILKTVYSASDVGLKLDFVNDVYTFGTQTSQLYIENGNGLVDINSQYNINFNLFPSPGNNVSLKLDGINNIIYSNYQGNDIGLKVDFANLYYALGTADGGDFATSIFGIKADVATYKVTVGDTWVNNATNIIIDASANQVIYTQNAGYQIGLTLDFASKRYFIGDDNVLAYDAYLGVESSATRNAIIAGVQLTAASAGTASGQFLKVRIGGVDYKLALLNN
jgi:hypothetical protein